MPKSLASDYVVLSKLGLSKTAVACYESLFELGGANVSQLAERLKLPHTRLYRVLKQLETKGFLTSLRTSAQPTYYFAQPLDKALSKYAHYQRGAVKELINEQTEILRKRSGKQPVRPGYQAAATQVDPSGRLSALLQTPEHLPQIS